MEKIRSLLLLLVLLIYYCTGIKLEFNETDSKIYLYASALAYCPPEQIMINQWKMATNLTKAYGIEPLYAYSNNYTVNDVIFAIMERKEAKELIVSFSGTKNPFQLIYEVIQSYPIKYSIHPELEEALVFEYAYGYYLQQFRDIYHKHLMEELEKRPDYKIIYAGHSLGGSFWVHAALDSILKEWIDPSRITIYTYGMPRVGNRQFIDAVGNKINGLFRVVHSTDLVPHIPPCIPKAFFKGCEKTGSLYVYPYHHTQEIYYDDKMKDYKICNEEEGEDPECSNSAYDFSINNHRSYYGVRVGRLHKDDEIIEAEEEEINIDALLSRLPHNFF